MRRSPIATLFLSLLMLGAAAAEPVQVPAILGDWADTSTEGDYIRLEAERFMGNDPASGSIQFLRASYSDKAIMLHTEGQVVSMPYRFDGALLVIDWEPTKKKTFKRLDQTPAAMQVPIITFGEAKALPAKQIQAIRKEFAQRVKRDQAVRKDPAQQDQMGAVDAENTAWLLKLTQDVGWIDGKRFGPETANHAFLLVQHSGNLPLMLAALPLIEADVKAKAVDGQNYALLYDRTRIYTGYKQRYGTQFSVGEDGVLSIFALEDKDKVEAFRQAIGVFPLELYLELIKQQAGVKKVVYLD